MLDARSEVDTLRQAIARYVARDVGVDSLRRTVDAIIERWRSALPSAVPPLNEIEGRLWHTVWQIEAACQQELAPDGVKTYLDILDGKLPAPAATERLRP